MRSIRSVLFVALPLVAAACSATSATSSSTGSTAGSVKSNDKASCAWPQSLEPPADAGFPPWRVAQHALVCTEPGGGSGCISNDATCTASSTRCTDSCTAKEFAITSGGLPIPLPDGGMDGPIRPDLPPSCRDVGDTPAGVSFYCCPCQ